MNVFGQGGPYITILLHNKKSGIFQKIIFLTHQTTLASLASKVSMHF